MQNNNLKPNQNDDMSPKSPRKSILKQEKGYESPKIKKTLNIHAAGPSKSNHQNQNPRISFKPDLIEIKEVESYKKYNTDMSEQKMGCCGSSKCIIQ